MRIAVIALAASCALLAVDNILINLEVKELRQQLHQINKRVGTLKSEPTQSAKSLLATIDPKVVQKATCDIVQETLASSRKNKSSHGQ